MERKSMVMGTAVLAMLLLMWLPMFIAPAAADTHIYVDQTSGINNTATLGTIENPFKSITYAMMVMKNRAAPDPWVLHVKAGSYDTNPAKPANEQEIFPIVLREGMTIQGEDGAENCIISGKYMTANVSLIKASDLSNIHIISMALSDNTRGSYANGGGCELINCSGSIQGCIIRNNYSPSGGGVWLSVRSGGQFGIFGNTFQNNSSTQSGGLFLHINGDSNVNIVENTFIANRSDYISAVLIWGKIIGDIEGNLFMENKTTNKTNSGSGFSIESFTGNIVENVFSSNEINYSPSSTIIQDGSFTGNITRNIFSVNKSDCTVSLKGTGSTNNVIANNVFIQNRSCSIYTDQNATIINNTFYDPSVDATKTAACVQINSTASQTVIKNNIIANWKTAMWEPTAMTIPISDNDFFNTTDILNRNNQPLGNDADFIQLSVPNFSNNHTWDSGIVGENLDSGTWSVKGYYEKETNRTIVIDQTKNWEPSQWAGKLLTEGQNQNRFLIVENTPTALYLKGNVAASVYVEAGDSYRIDSYQLLETSQNIDTGSAVATLTEDANGEPRPMMNGYDIGADEYPLSVIIWPQNLVISEPAGTATFTVKLSEAPTADVLVDMEVTNPTETTISGTSVRLTPQTWKTGVTVTVTAVDDGLKDGDTFCSILTRPGISADARFNGIDPPDVRLTVKDFSPDIDVVSAEPNFGVVGTALPVTIKGTGFVVPNSGKTLDFDGVNDYVQIPRSVQDDFTIEFWFKSSQIAGGETQWWNGMGMVDGEVGGVMNDFGVSLGNGKVLFGVGNPDKTVKSSSSLADGLWHHAAATRAKATGTITLYVDGKLVGGPVTASTASLTAPAKLRIGSLLPGNNPFSGQIDEVRIWNTARSQSQIQANMNKILQGTETGLVSYYRFDQDSGTELPDMTPNANTGTLTNFALTGETSNWVTSSAPVGTTRVFLLQRDTSGNLIGSETELTDFTFLSNTEIRLTIPAQTTPGQYNLRVSNGFQEEEFEGAVTFSEAAAVQAQNYNKAIIVAGGGPYRGNLLWSSTLLCVYKAYHALLSQGYSHDNIFLLSPEPYIDVNGDGINDVDASTGSSKLEYALSTWAVNTAHPEGSLVLYMTGHGGIGTFQMRKDDILQAVTLDGWMDNWNTQMTGRLMFIYDACMSGTFLPLVTPPAGMTGKRITIVSALGTERAWFLDDGKISFSYHFWESVFSKGYLYNAYAAGTEVMQFDQTPMMDYNGDGIADEITAGMTIPANDIRIGRGRVAASLIPEIGSYSPAQQNIECNISATVQISNITTLNGVARVWARVMPPSSGSIDLTAPILTLPTFRLLDMGGGIYRGQYDGFTASGIYLVFVYARDLSDFQSIPKMLSVYRNCGITVLM
ncbi:MAG: LamG-like jellyroll fold domain-containing protein, partial [Desulfococcaceae bacterium]